MTVEGRIITMISSIFGIGIIALPSGIITAGFMKEMSKRRSSSEDKEDLAAENDEGLNEDSIEPSEPEVE